MAACEPDPTRRRCRLALQCSTWRPCAICAAAPSRGRCAAHPPPTPPPPCVLLPAEPAAEAAPAAAEEAAPTEAEKKTPKAAAKPRAKATPASEPAAGTDTGGRARRERKQVGWLLHLGSSLRGLSACCAYVLARVNRASGSGGVTMWCCNVLVACVPHAHATQTHTQWPAHDPGMSTSAHLPLSHSSPAAAQVERFVVEAKTETEDSQLPWPFAPVVQVERFVAEASNETEDATVSTAAHAARPLIRCSCRPAVQVERFVVEAKKETEDVTVPEGSGERLRDIPNVAFKMGKMTGEPYCCAPICSIEPLMGCRCRLPRHFTRWCIVRNGQDDG